MSTSRLFFLAALFFSGLLFGAQKKSAEDCCPPPQMQECQGRGELLCQCSPGYNAPAAIDVNQQHWRCCPSGFSLFGNLSFIYWYAGEEGLALAETGALVDDTIYFVQDTDTLFQSGDYQPGFKIGLGATIDHETVVRAEYTRLRANTTTNSSTASGTIATAGTAAAASGVEVWVINDWFLQGTAGGQALCGSQVSSKWNLALDLVDLLVGRPFYQGRRLIVSPRGGLLAAFIRQSVKVGLTQSATLFDGATPPQPIYSHNHSNSWAIGPKIGLDAQYLLPRGFRFEADAAAALTYTRYSVKHSEDAASTDFNAGPYTASYSGYSALRPIAQLGLGMGWGRYFRGNDFHLDFSADYDFMIFWSQNMIRKLLDDTLTGTGPGSSDLYLHGLTLNCRFDF